MVSALAINSRLIAASPSGFLFGKQVGLEGLRPGGQRRPAATPRPVTATSARSAGSSGTAGTTRTN